MPLTTEFILLPLSTVWVDRDLRQRRSVDVTGLKESISRQGLIHPIVVERGTGPDGTHKLIAGERRLTACSELGHLVIPARFAENLSAIEAQIIELEENVKRADLTWQEQVQGVARIHLLYKGLESTWTVTETAEAIGMSKGIISMYAKVAGHLQEKRIAECSTVREAYNMLSRRDQRAAGEALAELLETEPVNSTEALVTSNVSELRPGANAELTSIVSTSHRPLATGHSTILGPTKSILHESFMQWAPRYEGKKFNLIHCDFPYGINLFAGPRQGSNKDDYQYDDSKDLFFNLLECLLVHRNKFMSESAHLMFWYSDKHRTGMLDVFHRLAPEIIIWPYPLIWHKTDNSGIAQDVRQGPRHVYETCLLATRAKRNIVQVKADVYGAPTDKKWHPSTKPEPMLRHFMEMLVDEQTTLLDPTCGSASSLRAAESLGAKTVLGMDVDEQTVGLARTALRQSRSMRGMKVVEG